ncbi:hypothetical protein HOT02_gp018 [Staphylococcus phage phiSA_BS2]|uniref:Uncharacterized protein n=1 Tax=Staphylococcus phage phiSA_BS2 TaxID=2126724 RepID=A0A2R3ZXK1_9CAUD|nr:hypothetical protein HOT02_gp018 [Staphylococcus phage phiSA_BS2]AVR55463.1 hypothetical protein phiSABS2_18 [Staphylococcus phage phiSA_BS2]
MDAFQARTLSIITKLEANKYYKEVLPTYTRSALEDIDKRIEYTASIGQSELKVETGDYPNLNREAFNYIKEDLKKKRFKVKFKTFKKDYGMTTLVSEGLLIKW